MNVKGKNKKFENIYSTKWHNVMFADNSTFFSNMNANYNLFFRNICPWKSLQLNTTTNLDMLMHLRDGQKVLAKKGSSYNLLEDYL